MFEQTDPQAQSVWASATPHAVWVGSRQLRPFSYTYRLEVKRHDGRLIALRTGTYTRQGLGFSGNLHLSERYVFMTADELKRWCTDHDAFLA